jgi:hypothetical protein
MKWNFDPSETLIISLWHLCSNESDMPGLGNYRQTYRSMLEGIQYQLEEDVEVVSLWKSYLCLCIIIYLKSGKLPPVVIPDIRYM